MKYVLSFIIPNTRATRRVGPHNKVIIDILFGSLLGDLYGERLKSGGIRFRFKQSIKHGSGAAQDNLFILYFQLLELGYTNNNLPRLCKDKFAGDSYRFDTYSFSNFLWLYK